MPLECRTAFPPPLYPGVRAPGIISDPRNAGGACTQGVCSARFENRCDSGTVGVVGAGGAARLQLDSAVAGTT